MPTWPPAETPSEWVPEHYKTGLKSGTDSVPVVTQASGP